MATFTTLAGDRTFILQSTGQAAQQISVVTGCASGLGAALVSSLLERGHRVHGIDVRAGEESRICFHACDLRSVEATEAAFARIAQREGDIDNLFNFAGIRGSKASVEQISAQEFAAVLEVNLFGTFHATRSAVPLLSKRGGNVINVGSILGRSIVPGASQYIASKFAIEGFTKACALELASRGIRVNAIAPGTVATPINLQAFESYDALMAAYGSCYPMGRICAPQDVVDAALWLTGPNAAFVTGQVLYVDGGYTLAN
ncbi:SDR family NAD(P)-dependent oxidoreductase [Aquamicrobium defluvii]|uniref:Short-chain dehydrogenase n=1 Tax=Aquamicrobium defluvii TaxID=69279 RepID=A0A011V581_9HYPH|nr:SDR family oxidoreductase [Aquamicrobium defluvii]EXL03610.1 short-chain dehydrogenase [Aquamicrobium defluvii]